MSYVVCVFNVFGILFWVFAIYWFSIYSLWCLFFSVFYVKSFVCFQCLSSFIFRPSSMSSIFYPYCLLFFILYLPSFVSLVFSFFNLLCFPFYVYIFFVLSLNLPSYVVSVFLTCLSSVVLIFKFCVFMCYSYSFCVSWNSIVFGLCFNCLLEIFEVCDFRVKRWNKGWVS